MGLFNLRPLKFTEEEMSAEFLGESVDETLKAPILQWVPLRDNVTVKVVMPDASIRNGLAESGLKAEPVGAVIQFVRFGFGRADEISSEGITVYFAHE